MKVKCPNCGFEDEGNFCSKCGSPLPKHGILAEGESLGTRGPVMWLNKCPVCKSGELLPSTKKRLLGLVTAGIFECDNCGAIFEQKGDKYKLVKVKNPESDVWKEYENQTLTDHEWGNIAHGGMSDAKQKESDLEHWMIQLKDGKIPISFGGETSVILKKNEELIFALPNISFLEPRAVRRTTGAYGGPSVKIAKGVYFRVGGIRAQSESHEELRNIDKGTLTLTNKRLVFSGAKRAINIDLKKIVSMTPYSDGIGLQTSSKQKTQYFTGIDQNKLAITVEDRKYTEPFSGLMLMYQMEGIIKQMD